MSISENSVCIILIALLKLALAYFARCGHNERGSAVYIVFCDVNIKKRVEIPYSLERIVRGERRAEIGNADVV